MSTTADARAQAAMLVMERNRTELLEVYAPSRKPNQFPRSATFRWLGSHLSVGSVATTLMSAALFKPAWLRILGMFVARRRGRSR
jgi:hypothetical protein